MPDITTTIECPKGHEFNHDFDDEDFNYSPEQKQVNYPNEDACPHIRADADFVGDTAMTCPECGTEFNLTDEQKEKLENEYLEEVKNDDKQLIAAGRVLRAQREDKILVDENKSLKKE
jgi:hypothetical protein